MSPIPCVPSASTEAAYFEVCFVVKGEDPLIRIRRQALSDEHIHQPPDEKTRHYSEIAWEIQSPTTCGVAKGNIRP
jgi:hypothetical protein